MSSNENLKAVVPTPYVCPENHQPLFLDQTSQHLVTEKGEQVCSVESGIAQFISRNLLTKNDKKALEFYDPRVEQYDKCLHLTFKTHFLDEKNTRKSFIDKLELKPGYRVLEIACGTGRDSELIIQELRHQGEICLLDISPNMLKACQDRLRNVQLTKHFCQATASKLPFGDNYFDATYSFGGLGEFSSIQQSLSEMVRVTKTGSKVVVGDESMPPWLRDTEFAKILTLTNPQFAAELPLADLPVDVREVNLKWVIGGVFYLIDFVVGKGEPPADFDFEIPGERGGTYRTRYEGQLEGVTSEAKRLALEATRKQGISMHRWLDEAVKKAAQDTLGGK